MAAEIRNFYFSPNLTVDANSFLNYSTLISDFSFVYPIDKAVKYQSQLSTGNTFYYR